jgi:hypothetical protein
VASSSIGLPFENNDHFVRAAGHEPLGVSAVHNHHIRTGAGVESIVGAKSPSSAPAWVTVPKTSRNSLRVVG